MKKKTLFIAVLALVCACISCNKEKELVQEPAEYLLTAGTEATGDDTKTHIADGNWGKEIRWNEKDQISVFSQNSGTYTYTLKEGANTISGIFSTQTKPDFKSDSKYVAYYPASVVKNDNGRTFNWPSEQTRELSNAEKVALPLLAEGDIDNGAPSNATFNCLGGILDIQLKVPTDGVPGYLRKVVITTDQKISGKFTLQTVTEHVRDSEGEFTSETVEKKYAVIANDGLNTITYTLEGSDGKGLYIPSGEAIERKLMFAMPVSPAGGYTNFQVDFYDEHDTRISGAKSKNPLIIERGMITNANIPFSHKYAPGLTMNDPVGTIGTLYGVEAIVIEVGGYKRALALHNVGYTDADPFGTEFSVDSNWNPTPALELKNGWRLPYVEEWQAIADTYGKWQKLEGSNPQNLPLRITVDKTVDLPFVAWSRYYICANHAVGYVIGPDPNGYYCMSSNDNVDYISSIAYVRAIRELPFYPELDPERQLTKDDPVGSIGMIGTRQAVVMKLRGRKVAVATVDVGGSVPEEAGSKFHFTNSGYYHWDYDQLNLPDGWRLPTSQEINELANDYVKIDDGNVWRVLYSDATSLVVPKHTDYASSETCYYYSGTINEHCLSQIGSLDACARPVYDLERITRDSPEGTVGVVDGRECVVVAGTGGRKFLITTNNPGPCYGGFGLDGRDTPWRYDSYKHGTFRTPKQAQDDITNAFYGKGWQLPSHNDMKNLVQWNDAYTRGWNESEHRLEVYLPDYTWCLYTGGWIDPGEEAARNTETGYYLCMSGDQFEYYKIECDHKDTNLIREDYDFKCRYNFCLTHEMPN